MSFNKNLDEKDEVIIHRFFSCMYVIITRACVCVCVSAAVRCWLCFRLNKSMVYSSSGERGGLRSRLFQFGKFRQNVLPLACSGAPGEKSNTTILLWHNNTRQRQHERRLCQCTAHLRGNITCEKNTSKPQHHRHQHHRGQIQHSHHV